MSLGYQGFARIFTEGQDGGDPTIPGNGRLLLCTASSVNLEIEPIYSNAVYGAGWYNAPSKAHYADSALSYAGGLSFDFQASSDVWNFIRDWAIEERAWPRSLSISPDGQNIYQYFVSDNSDNALPYGPGIGAVFNNKGAWCSSLSLTTSQGSAVQATANVMAIFRTIGAGGTNYIDNRTGFILGTGSNVTTLRPLNPGQANIDPIPFWKTNANLYVVANDYNPLAGTPTPTQAVQTSGNTTPETIQWSVDLTNNTLKLYTMNGTRFPSAVLQGAIDATGSVELFDSAFGVYDPVTTGRTAENTMFRVRIRTNAESAMTPTYVYVDMPAVVINSDDFGLKGQSDPVTRTFSLQGLGLRLDGSDNVYPPLFMTLAV